MRSTRRLKLVALLGTLLLVSAVAAWAGMFGSFFVLEGTLESPLNFGSNPVGGTTFEGNTPLTGTQDATVMFQELVIQPGISTGFHYHRALSYVVLVKGTLTEQKGGDCSIETHSAGSAFLENPNEVHDVTNNGPENVILIWATVFPKGDFPPGDVFSGVYVPTTTPCQ